MKAIIVPGVTDLNKGDQALVWESYRLAKDTGLYDQIQLLTVGDTPEEKELLCGQSKRRGFSLVENILKHPRRGNHKNEESIKESKKTYILLVINAIKDFLSGYFLLLICNNSTLVKTFYPKMVNDTIKSFKECDTVFVKGGGFIHAYGERTAPYLMWYFLFYIRLAKKLRKKVVFLPNSFGPFEGFTVKKQVKKVLSKVDLIYAREHLSATKISELLGKKVPVQIDLGFYLQSGEVEKSHEILKRYNISQDDKVVGITIRPWRFPGKSNPNELYSKYITSVEKLIEHVLNRGYKVALCNQSIGPNSHEDDRNAIEIIYKNIKHENLIWINENLPCDELKAVYSNFYFFIGTRFHSVIFSMTSLVPSIAIGYGGNKGKGIMGDFNLDEYVIQIDDITPDQIIRMFDNGIENYIQIKENLKKNIDKLEISRANIIEEIKSIS